MTLRPIHLPARHSLTCTEVYVVIFECLLLVEEQFMYPTPFLVLVLFPRFLTFVFSFPVVHVSFLPEFLLPPSELIST